MLVLITLVLPFLLVTRSQLGARISKWLSRLRYRGSAVGRPQYNLGYPLVFTASFLGLGSQLLFPRGIKVPSHSFSGRFPITSLYEWLSILRSWTISRPSSQSPRSHCRLHNFLLCYHSSVPSFATVDVVMRVWRPLEELTIRMVECKGLALVTLAMIGE